MFNLLPNAVPNAVGAVKLEQYRENVIQFVAINDFTYWLCHCLLHDVTAAVSPNMLCSAPIMKSRSIYSFLWFQKSFSNFFFGIVNERFFKDKNVDKMKIVKNVKNVAGLQKVKNFFLHLW